MTATRRAFLGGLGAAAVVATTGALPVPAAPLPVSVAAASVDPHSAWLAKLARLVESLAEAMEVFGPDDWAETLAWSATRPPSLFSEVVALMAEIAATDDLLECAAALRACSSWRSACSRWRCSGRWWVSARRTSLGRPSPPGWPPGTSWRVWACWCSAIEAGVGARRSIPPAHKEGAPPRRTAPLSALVSPATWAAPAAGRPGGRRARAPARCGGRSTAAP